MTLALPSVGEALLYVRRRGVRRAVSKLLAEYVIGRERWYLTIEDLTRWIGQPLEPTPLELRAARLDDLPHMDGFAERQHPNTLRKWFGPDYFFFVATADGRSVAYRCLGRRVHRSVAGIVTLAPHQLFVVDEFTVPAFRRRGITRQLAISTNPPLIDAGFREVVGIHWTDNENTIAATQAKGIVTIGTLSCLRLGPKTVFSYEPGEESVTAPLSPLVRRRRRRAAPIGRQRAGVRAT